MKELNVSFWRPVGPPPALLGRERATEVDLCVTFDSAVVFVEVKYRARLARGTARDVGRDQLIRLLDVAYSYAVAGQFLDRRPYVFVLGVGEEEPELVTRYRNPKEVASMLSHYRHLPGHEEIASRLSAAVGYLSWGGLERLLGAAAVRARILESALLQDVAGYIRHKMQVAEQGQAKGTLLLPLAEQSLARVPDGLQR